MKLLAFVMAGAAVSLGACSTERTPPSSVEVKTTYSDASRRLTIACVKASSGTCHVLLDNGGQRRTLTLKPGTTEAVERVDPAARTCSSARPTEEANCSWASVGPSAAA